MKFTKDAQHNPKCERRRILGLSIKSSRNMQFTKAAQHNPKCEEEEF
jgi:hypothetical protein